MEFSSRGFQHTIGVRAIDTASASLAASVCRDLYLKYPVGIHVLFSKENNIANNTISKNSRGINIVNSYWHNITENTFIENTECAVRISGAYNNTFCHNNFINNTSPDSQSEYQIYNPGYWSSDYEANIWDSAR
jgi:parallel beta-helix repeat protein